MKKIKDKKIFIIIGISLILSIITGVIITYVEKLSLYDDFVESIFKFTFANINWISVIIAFVMYMTIGIILYNAKSRKFVYEKRFIISGILFVICVIFQINGSSIGIWNKDFPSAPSGVIVGASRMIRGDEWAIQTPLAIAQENSLAGKYQYFNSALRGGKIDMNMVCPEPCYDISVIFKPFYIGYLLFGSAYGLAFYWCARFILLFLSVFELGMVITKKNKWLSLALACLVLFAPVVQWWYAAGGLVEMLIAMSISIVLFNKYLKTDSFKKRTIYAIIIGICAGMFVLVMYPGWQVVMAYLTLGLAIWTIIENKKDIVKIKKKDILIIALVVLVVISILGYVLIKSSETIKITMQTIYPGQRCETGGDVGTNYFKYPLQLFTSYFQTGLSKNVCEESTFFDLFPMGFILTILIFIKDKKKDPLLIILMVIEVIIGIFCVFGFPEWLSKITLLCLAQANRAFVVIGLINVLMLIRAISIMKYEVDEKISIIIALVVSIVIMILSCITNIKFWNANLINIVFAGIILFAMYFLALKANSKKYQKVFCVSISVLLVLIGFFINPMRTGIPEITENQVGNEIRKINTEESGKWIVIGDDFYINNFPIMYGAETINSINTYPNFELWKKIDPEEKYKDVYNRYATVYIRLVSRDKETKFYNILFESFLINLNIKDMKKLDIKYIFIQDALGELTDGDVLFEEKYHDNGFRIYKVNYKE